MAQPQIKTDIEARVQDTGDVMTGSLFLPGDPTENLEATTKEYVDNKINTAYSTKSSKVIDTENTTRITFDNLLSLQIHLVFYNGLLLTLGEEYDVENGNTVVLLDWVPDINDVFIVFAKKILDTDNDHTHLIGNIDGLQTQLNSKFNTADIITGTEDLEAGVSPLGSGKIYLVLEMQ